MADAQNSHDDSAEALKALAEGNLTDFELQQSQDQSSAQGDQAAAPFDSQQVLDAPGPADENAPMGVAQDQPQPQAAEEESPQARQERTAALAARTRRAHFHQFKSIMIPLLLAVGVLLFVCGAFVLIYDGDAEGVEIDPPTGLLGNMRSWFPIAAFVVGAILLAGAWLFRRDLKAAQEK
jgi:uncharacterized membrane protein